MKYIRYYNDAIRKYLTEYLTNSYILSAGVLHSPVPVPDPGNPACQSCHPTWIHGWHSVLPHTKVGETKGYPGKMTQCSLCQNSNFKQILEKKNISFEMPDNFFF